MLQWCGTDDPLQADANLAATAAAQQLRTQQLRTDLQRRTLQWADSHERSEASSNKLPDTSSITLLKIAGETLAGTQNKPLAGTRNETLVEAEREAPVEFSGGSEPLARGPLSQGTCVTRARQARRLNRHALRYLAATLAVSILLLAVASSLTRRSPSTTAPSASVATRATPQDAPQDTPQSMSAPASIFEAAALKTNAQHTEHEQQTAQTLALLTDSVLAPDLWTGANESKVDPLASMQSAARGSVDSSSQPVPTANTQGPSSQPSAGIGGDHVDPEDSPPSAVAADARPAASETRPAGTDVLTELAALSKSAEAATSEVMVPSPEPVVPEPAGIVPAANSPAISLPANSPAANGAAANESTRSAPLLLQSFPMIQLQEFDKRLRPRQPRWRLRLAASEGLEALPSEPQELGEEQVVSWTIRSVESSQTQAKKTAPPLARDDTGGATRAVIQVQMRSKRETSLRWRIMATNDRYPQIALPLDQAWLDRFQEYLSNYIVQLQQESQRMRELGRADGLPSQTRSALATRRRGLDSEGKLATELLEIVADANQLVGWLDGQIEVHGDLLDTAANPSKPLLQFGNAEQAP